MGTDFLIHLLTLLSCDFFIILTLILSFQLPKVILLLNLNAQNSSHMVHIAQHCSVHLFCLILLLHFKSSLRQIYSHKHIGMTELSIDCKPFAVDTNENNVRLKTVKVIWQSWLKQISQNTRCQSRSYRFNDLKWRPCLWCGSLWPCGRQPCSHYFCA